MDILSEEEARRVSLDLMGTSAMVHVGTLDEDGIPQIRIMFNLRNRKSFPSLTKIFEGHDDDFLVYLGTNTSSRKMAQIRENPAMCVCYSNYEEYRSLMLSGYSEIVDDVRVKNAIWQDGWEIYYSQGPGDPDYAVLRLLPIKAKGWHRSRPFEFRIGSER